MLRLNDDMKLPWSWFIPDLYCNAELFLIQNTERFPGCKSPNPGIYTS